MNYDDYLRRQVVPSREIEGGCRRGSDLPWLSWVGIFLVGPCSPPACPFTIHLIHLGVLSTVFDTSQVLVCVDMGKTELNQKVSVPRQVVHACNPGTLGGQGEGTA